MYSNIGTTKKCYKFVDLLHWDVTIRIIEKRKNCQMWNSDVPPKPYIRS